MKNRIKKLIESIESFVPDSKEKLEEFRINFLGKKGKLQAIFGEFKSVPAEDKKELGQLINRAKQKAQEKIEQFKSKFSDDENQVAEFDYTLPGQQFHTGSLHPITLVLDEITGIFERMGFNISEGRELVTDWENFEALNFEEHHPARDMQDTFFINLDPQYVLRTHTSSVQVKEMKKGLLPIRTISPGRVFRNETISARSHCQFHQVEGLYVAEKVSFADLRQTLYEFAREYFGNDVKVRFRPSYFPFTEPSAEMDVYKGLKTEADYKITKGTGWLEILGCGMVDPNVLENCGIDSNKYTGFAFGLGIERIALIKYQISDIRVLFENDLRFLQQFSSFL